MNLRELEYLVALADQQNFRRAAEICHVSQPTLSTQLRKMEDELGVTLVERMPRKAVLTAAGEAVVARARRVLDEIAQIRAETASHRKTGSTRLRLGVFPTLGPYLLPEIVPAFVARFPSVELLLTEEKSDLLLRQLLGGQIDAALLALPLADPHLVGRVLFSEPFLLAVPGDHPLATQDRIGPEALLHEELMLLEEGHCLREQALDVCRLSGAHERNGFRGTSLETLRQMVVAGVGSTLLPQLATRRRGQDSGQEIHLLSFSDEQLRRRIGLFWRKTSSLSRLLNEVSDLIAEIGGELLAPPPPRSAP
ncbi:LysR substrate-binding domain-containing protein [Paracoccus aminophilus]|uniref:Oxidative stress transcriptional regulator, LysR family n=1 Tax=Paracoccus aminophilus JCM 7686 TaxID=1367847 RepID=S5YSQ8_PARAH|nr:LysR substrate-binding domain-containing protein [Paracoccus aminophilus]AGT08271.1 oxidative stress transcriptional regulator, LysR family [Paracoccus aminophilus JCM 7686]